MLHFSSTRMKQRTGTSIGARAGTSCLLDDCSADRPAYHAESASGADSTRDGDDECLNLAVDGPRTEPRGDGFSGTIRCFAESGGVAFLNLVS